MATPRAHTAQVIPLRHPGLRPVSRRTHALVKADSLELVELVLPAGADLPTHAAPGEVTLFGLQGCLVLQLVDRTLRLAPGDLIHLCAGEPHAVHAEADSRALLTLCLHRAAPVSAGIAAGDAGADTLHDRRGSRQPQPVPASCAEAARMQARFNR